MARAFFYVQKNIGSTLLFQDASAGKLGAPALSFQKIGHNYSVLKNFVKLSFCELRRK